MTLPQFLAEVRRIALMECPKYVTHPQSVWWDEHVQRKLRAALARYEDAQSEKILQDDDSIRFVDQGSSGYQTITEWFRNRDKK